MKSFDGLTFEVTDDHIKLLRRAYVSWDECEYGAPAIDCKRPYGNSSVEDDIVEILGWLPNGFDEEELPRELMDRARRVHEGTLVALQIALITGSFTPGRYYRSSPWSNEWRAV